MRRSSQPRTFVCVAVSVAALACALSSCAFGDPVDLGTSAGGTTSDVTGSVTSNTTGTGGGAQGGGGSTSTGTGGAGPVCGDGEIDATEECDDANLIDGDGCTTCVIDCEAAAEKDPTTGRCYRFYPGAKTWAAAESDCEAWGGASGLGHLVSISSAAEQQFVEALRPTISTWIGARDTVTEGTFEWLDGTPFAFTSFAPGKPDGATVQNCLFMRGDNDGWDDNQCGTALGFVCERGPAGAP